MLAMISYRTDSGLRSERIVLPSCHEGEPTADSDWHGAPFLFRRALLLLLASMALLSLRAQSVGLGTNTLYLATSAPNVSLDLRLADHWSVTLQTGWNPWRFPSRTQAGTGEEINPKMLHWSVSPEVKYWFCKTFRRSYVGLHALAVGYNVGGLPFPPQLRSYRYEGVGCGAGVSWGYQWAPGGRWGLELSLGAGYVWFRYHKNDCRRCGDDHGTFTRSCVGPTKAALSLIYYIR